MGRMGLLTLIPSYLNVKNRHQPLPKRPLANVDVANRKLVNYMGGFNFQEPILEGNNCKKS